MGPATARRMSESAETADAKKPAASGNKLVMIIGIVNLLAVAGVGAYLVLGAKHAAPASAKAPAGAEGGGHGEKPAEGEHGEAKEEGGHGEAKEGAGGHAVGEVKEIGPIIPLEPMVTNLAAPDSDHYLKVTVQLRATSEVAKPEVEASMVPIRSQILLFLSSLTMEDTSSSEKKREIQAKLKRIANEAMPTSRVTHVYFTEFVIQ